VSAAAPLIDGVFIDCFGNEEALHLSIGHCAGHSPSGVKIENDVPPSPMGTKWLTEDEGPKSAG
jgi:hypothetical protein